MPSVQFKLKSQKDFDAVEFEGMFISVHALKRAIIAQKLKSAGDSFGLVLSNAQTSEEYLDDAFLVPANTSVLVRRVPLAEVPTASSASEQIAGGGAPVDGSAGLQSQAMPSSSGARTSSGHSTTPLGLAPHAQRPPQAAALQPAAASDGAAHGAPRRPVEVGATQAPTSSTVPLARSEPLPPGVLRDQLPISDQLPLGAVGASAPLPAYVTGPIDGLAAGGGDAPHRGAEEAMLKAMMSDEADKWRSAAGGGGGRGYGGYGRGEGRGRAGAHGRGDGRGRAGAPAGPPPAGYVCFRCGIPGHFIQNCPSGSAEPGTEVKLHRAPVGIPRAFLQAVDAEVDGALLLPDGTYARMVPQEHQFEEATKREPAAGQEVPDELRCPAPTCGRLFREPVVLPCCGNSVCSECVPSVLQHDGGDEDEGARCLLCGESGVSVDALFPNRQLRSVVATFKEAALRAARESQMEASAKAAAAARLAKAQSLAARPAAAPPPIAAPPAAAAPAAAAEPSRAEAAVHAPPPEPSPPPQHAPVREAPSDALAAELAPLPLAASRAHAPESAPDVTSETRADVGAQSAVGGDAREDDEKADGADERAHGAGSARDRRPPSPHAQLDQPAQAETRLVPAASSAAAAAAAATASRIAMSFAGGPGGAGGFCGFRPASVPLGVPSNAMGTGGAQAMMPPYGLGGMGGGGFAQMCVPQHMGGQMGQHLGGQMGQHMGQHMGGQMGQQMGTMGQMMPTPFAHLNPLLAAQMVAQMGGPMGGGFNPMMAAAMGMAPMACLGMGQQMPTCAGAAGAGSAPGAWHGISGQPIGACAAAASGASHGDRGAAARRADVRSRLGPPASGQQMAQRFASAGGVAAVAGLRGATNGKDDDDDDDDDDEPSIVEQLRRRLEADRLARERAANPPPFAPPRTRDAGGDGEAGGRSTHRAQPLANGGAHAPGTADRAGARADAEADADEADVDFGLDDDDDPMAGLVGEDIEPQPQPSAQPQPQSPAQSQPQPPAQSQPQPRSQPRSQP
ncbi:hypothetical protein KFE25_006175 [Diacronema lutheri]|uniref:DWNN domain-containing protein n=1 Tax=Diacronema lutheri TaxID=2081491 RepID=A0A8J5Y1N3_DIALT|nr:hypothetical protein KFE25_006175 [Diacronema lutheri]